MVIYVYTVIAVLFPLVLDKFTPVFRQSYSIWLVPLLFLGALLALIILNLAVFAVSVALVNLKKPPRAAGYYKFIAKVTVPLIFKIMRVKITVKGEDLLPQNTRFVMVCNHTHIFDPALFMAALPQAEFAFMGKKEIIKEMPFVAKFIHSQGGLFVDRENSRGSARAAVDAIRLLKGGKASLGIFPEGHRTKDGTLQPFKDGAFKIAMKAGVPTAVCTVRGATEILHNLPFKRSQTEIRVLRVITPPEYEGKTAAQISEISRNIMLEDLL